MDEKKVTFFVAECMEFHSLGVMYENISSIEEAIKIYENLPDYTKSMGNGIGAMIDDWEYPLLDNGVLDNVKYFQDIIQTNDTLQNAINVVNQYIDGKESNKIYDELPDTDTKKDDITLHLQYKEPIRINGFICNNDTIKFGNIEEFNKFISGAAAYDYLDNSVKIKENEILQYAENEVGEIIWSSDNNFVQDVTSMNKTSETINIMNLSTDEKESLVSGVENALDNCYNVSDSDIKMYEAIIQERSFISQNIGYEL